MYHIRAFAVWLFCKAHEKNTHAVLFMNTLKMGLKKTDSYHYRPFALQLQLLGHLYFYT